MISMLRHNTARLGYNANAYVLDIFRSLVADICESEGKTLSPPDDISYEWVLNAAPKLDKDLLKWLEGMGEYPIFPEWITPLTDAFRLETSPKLLRAIRQILLFCYKIEHEPTNDQLKAAQAAFEEVDEDTACWDPCLFGKEGPRVVLSTARQIVGRIIYDINWSEIVPAHGPGGIFPTRLPSAKSRFMTIYTTIDQYYPFADYYCGIPSFWDHHLWVGDGRLRESREIVARLVAVPKDSRGPRLICVHPAEAIWVQQGCRKLLERAITRRRSAASGKINFSDQLVNGMLALDASRSRWFTTLDLKEASDRMSCGLVEFLFGKHAYRWLSCSRATKVRLLDNRVITLKKWAPMGNALCFPVQSLVFYALVRAAIRCRYGENCNDVYVFGDDIIFPTKYRDAVNDAFVACGLVPNASKTFSRGFFRESCGVDAYKGVDVTPLRLRKTDVRSVSGATAMCALAKELYISGYRLASDKCYAWVSQAGWKLQFSNNPDCQGISRYVNVGFDSFVHYGSIRFNTDFQKYESRILLVGGRHMTISNGAWWHLQDALLRIQCKFAEISDRGLEYAVPHCVQSKRGWTDVLMTSIKDLVLQATPARKRRAAELDRVLGRDI